MSSNFRTIAFITLKSQVIVDKETTQIICTSFKNGKCHDFRLFKESRVMVQPKIKMAVDTGYQGLQKSEAKYILFLKQIRIVIRL